MALEGPRVLTQEIESLSTDYTPSRLTPKGNWFIGTSSTSIMYESYFDLSGYQLDDLTFMPQGTVVQDPGTYKSNNPTMAFAVLDIISQERLTIAQIETAVLANNMPGMSETTQDFIQIVAGTYRLMTPNTTLLPNLLTTIQRKEFGSGSPSTVAKLWCYRFVTPVEGVWAAGNTLEIPAARFILTGTVIQESDLPFLMRQKRSYELATQG